MKNLRYWGRLVRSLGWSARPGPKATLAMLLVVMLGASAAIHGGSAFGGGVGNAGIDTLVDRANNVSALLERTRAVYAEEVAPIERVLLGYRSDDPQLVRRVATSLVREARHTNLEPRLLLAVLLVENPWIDPEATSFVGAQGLMQVMPMHRGKWAPCEPRLDDVEANICHGARIFAYYLQAEKGNVDRALLRYNGCVRGTNTPNCHQYPNHVYARAGRASILAWRNTTGMAASR